MNAGGPARRHTQPRIAAVTNARTVWPLGYELENPGTPTEGRRTTSFPSSSIAFAAIQSTTGAALRRRHAQNSTIRPEMNGEAG